MSCVCTDKKTLVHVLGCLEEVDKTVSKPFGIKYFVLIVEESGHRAELKLRAKSSREAACSAIKKHYGSRYFFEGGTGNRILSETAQERADDSWSGPTRYFGLLRKKRKKRENIYPLPWLRVDVSPL